MVAAIVIIALAALGRLSTASKPWLGTHQGILGDILFWALPAALATFFFAGGPVWHAPLLVVLWWFGRIILGWGDLNYIGKSLIDEISNYNLMRGVFVTFLPALLTPHPIILILSGATMPLAYYLGARVPTLNKSFLNQGPEIGDVIYYAFVAVGIVLSEV